MLRQLVSEENLERAAWLSRRSKVHAKSIVQPHGVWRMRGPLHGTSQPLSLLAIGPAGFEHQLAHVFLAEVTETQRLGQVGRFEERRSWARADDDIVAHVLRPWERPAPDEFRMAMAVDACITMAGTPHDHVMAHLAQQHRRAWNHREKLGAQYQLSSSAADLRFWYEQLHVPLLQRRHREHAHLPPLDEFAARLDRTEVLLARIRGEVVAGVLLEHDRWGGTLTRTASGATVPIADDSKLYKTLTIALEYRGLERAHERKIPRYSLGFTLPRVDGGLYGYKRRWGTSFVPDIWSWPAAVHLRPRRRPEVLEHAPVITQPEGVTAVLLGATGDDQAALGALQERIKLASFPNAGRIVVCAAPAHAARIRQTVGRGVVVEEVTGAEVPVRPAPAVTPLSDGPAYE